MIFNRLLARLQKFLSEAKKRTPKFCVQQNKLNFLKRLIFKLFNIHINFNID